jgi:hypothetical protein
MNIDLRNTHHRVTAPRHPMLLIISLVLLVTAVPSIGNAMQIDPTEEPTSQFQAVPTSTPELPIQAAPSPTPTPRMEPTVVEVIPSDPTAVPTREIDGFQDLPTAVPTEEVDDLQDVPTAAPTEEIGDFQASPAQPSTLTVRKWVCPPFYDPFAASPMEDCTESLNGVIFDLANHDAGQAGLQAVTGSSIDGAALFQPPPGTYTLSEQIPDGFEQPFLGSCADLANPAATFPAPWLGNGYTLEIGLNQVIECEWMNVIDNDNHLITVTKLDCPEGVDPSNDDYLSAIGDCHLEVEGVAFTLVTEAGAIDGVTGVGGEIVWTDIDLGASGQIQITEHIPDGYGEPEVWCVSFPEEAADPEDFDQIWVPATNGTVTVSPEQHEPYRFSCVFLNKPGSSAGPGQGQGQGPGQSQNPGQGAGQGQNPGQGAGQGAGQVNTVTVVKRACTSGIASYLSLAEYIGACADPLDGVDFTLSHAGGLEAGTTAGGEVEWSDVPGGDIEIQESIPDGFGAPIVFCGYSDEPGGPIYHIAQVDTDDGVVQDTLVAGPIDYLCYWMNIPAQGNGSGLVRVIKRTCPLGVVETAGIADYLVLCAQEHNDVDFTLDHQGGSETSATAGGQAEWTNVALGPFSITETIPAGYKDPLVFCGFTESPGGGVQHPTLQDAQGGAVTGSIDLDDAEYVCYWFNLKLEPVGGQGPGGFTIQERTPGTSELTVRMRSCPITVPSGQDLFQYRDQCPDPIDGSLVTFTNDQGESSKPLVSGDVTWTDLPLGAFTVQQSTPELVDDPIVFCSWTAFHDGAVYDGFAQLVPAQGGLIDREIVVPDTSYLCEYFNLQGGPGEIVSPDAERGQRSVHPWA